MACMNNYSRQCWSRINGKSLGRKGIQGFPNYKLIQIFWSNDKQQRMEKQSFEIRKKGSFLTEINTSKTVKRSVPKYQSFNMLIFGLGMINYSLSNQTQRKISDTRRSFQMVYLNTQSNIRTRPLASLGKIINSLHTKMQIRHKSENQKLVNKSREQKIIKQIKHARKVEFPQEYDRDYRGNYKQRMLGTQMSSEEEAQIKLKSWIEEFNKTYRNRNIGKSKKKNRFSSKQYSRQHKQIRLQGYMKKKLKQVQEQEIGKCGKKILSYLSGINCQILFESGNTMVYVFVFVLYFLNNLIERFYIQL